MLYICLTLFLLCVWGRGSLALSTISIVVASVTRNRLAQALWRITPPHLVILDRLGLLSDNPVHLCGSPLATLCSHLEQVLKYQVGEKDAIFLHHFIGIQWPNNKVRKEKGRRWKLIRLHVGVVNPIIISWFGRERGKLRVSYSTDSSVFLLIFYLNLRITENDGAIFWPCLAKLHLKYWSKILILQLVGWTHCYFGGGNRVSHNYSSLREGTSTWTFLEQWGYLVNTQPWQRWWENL